MGFLSRAFRNRGLLQNLSRDPVARIEPIAPPINPIENIPILPQAPVLPIAPLPVEKPRLPFERLPREDFLSIGRLNNIPELEPAIPPILPPRPPVNIGGPTLDISSIPERPIIPPKPPSIGGVGGTDFEDKRSITKTPILPPPLEDFGFGPGIRPTEMIGPDGQFIGSASITPPVTRSPVITEPVVTPNPIIEPAPTTPAAVATDVGAVPVTTIPQDVRGQVDPVLAQQDTQEILTDPLLRALYFGTADQPGYLNQLQQATANLIGSDVPLQQTAGLSELEKIAQDRALADLGVAEPFIGERADLLRGATREFDPNMTQQFFNPYEDRVVQQTIQDVMDAAEKRDIAQRFKDIQTGGLSAFGSRARLSAAERQRALGRGLTEALGGIRQTGFDQAQRDALSAFAQQRQAEQTAATGLGQVGTQLADLRAADRSSLAGFGQTGRGIEETGLGRLFQQQLDQQGRPLQALQLTGQLLPQFQAGQTRIDSEYRMPVDPGARGLGAALSAYSALAPGQTSDLSGLGAAFSGYGAT
tara:strand:- start:10271 stop:11866 length:1596 start_codon:yes stop_codon:yes gene_type:complete